MTTVDLPDEKATGALAARVAKLAAPGDVIALSGPLGAGKTVFARAFIRARARGVEIGDVPSPTFTLVQCYELPGGTVWHFDCYRLRREDEAWELGIEDAFAEGISLIEWPDRIAALLPPHRLDIELSPGPSSGSRKAALSGWKARLDA